MVNSETLRNFFYVIPGCALNRPPDLLDTYQSFLVTILIIYRRQLIIETMPSDHSPLVHPERRIPVSVPAHNALVESRVFPDPPLPIKLL